MYVGANPLDLLQLRRDVTAGCKIPKTPE
jgi:hypothetical protein